MQTDALPVVHSSLHGKTYLQWHQICTYVGLPEASTPQKHTLFLPHLTPLMSPSSSHAMQSPPAGTRNLGKQNLSSGLSYVGHLSPLAQAGGLNETQIVIIEHWLKLTLMETHRSEWKINFPRVAVWQLMSNHLMPWWHLLILWA